MSRILDGLSVLLVLLFLWLVASLAHNTPQSAAQSAVYGISFAALMFSVGMFREACEDAAKGY
jgi:hypothetical protein